MFLFLKIKNKMFSEDIFFKIIFTYFLGLFKKLII